MKLFQQPLSSWLAVAPAIDHRLEIAAEMERARLKAKGWVETTVDELFGLDEVDRQVVELRVRLAREVRRRREEAGLTQKAMAGRLGETRPRVAEVEGGGAGVILDNLVSAYLATGASLSDLAAVIGGS